MSYFINKITINDLGDLKHCSIRIENEEAPHLIITGENGSGKSLLVQEIARMLEEYLKDENYELLKYKPRPFYSQNFKGFGGHSLSAEEKKVGLFYQKIKIVFDDVDRYIEDCKQGKFIIASYNARRCNDLRGSNVQMMGRIRFGIDEMLAGNFMNFVSNSFEVLHEDGVNWLGDFKKILRKIYNNDDLDLEYLDYDLRVTIGNRAFGINKMSDGYASIVSIVVDLMLKMQGNRQSDNISNNCLNFNALQKPGIVLIDDVEAYLHVDMQKRIMPILTEIFPNVQFIITTHSPYVLGSLKNAVAYDLDHKQLATDLTQYSSSALAEGYFGVSEESSYVKMQLSRLKRLLDKEDLDEGEVFTLKRLVGDFEGISEPVLPNIKGEYMRLKGDYMDVFRKWEVL